MKPFAWIYENITGTCVVHWSNTTAAFIADQEATTKWPKVHTMTPVYTEDAVKEEVARTRYASVCE